MRLRRKIRHLSEQLVETREFWRVYRELTPVRHGSQLELYRYYRKNRDRTHKLFGLVDTGIKDYGMNLYSRPGHTLRLYACMYRFWRLQRRQERESRQPS